MGENDTAAFKHWYRRVQRLRLRIKEGILDDFGAAIQVDPANARPAAHSVSG